jgi:ABC-type molybdenum transport system ATPase subunit/photorepair protein PhrA
MYSHEIFDSLLDLPMGLMTYMFWHGKNVSRLERTIILLARAMVHEPILLFLDDIFIGLSADQQAVLCNYLASLSITRLLVATNEKDLPLNPNAIITLEGHGEVRC